MEFSYRIIEAADREAFKNYILPDMAQAASETDDGVIMVGAVSDGKETCGGSSASQYIHCGRRKCKCLA